MKTTSAQRMAVSRARARSLENAIKESGLKWTGRFPAPANQERYEAARASLLAFCRMYLPAQFDKPISSGQEADIATMESVVRHGERYAFAAPRGDGKTTRAEAAVLWAALFNLRFCVVVVGSDRDAAAEIVDGVKAELRSNDLLREDFPIPCWAAMLSDDVALKAKSWTWGGKNIGFEWSVGRVILPNVVGACKGCAIVPRGLTGRLRGMRVRIGKRSIRPDLYVIDDPQTDESANSESQCNTREKLVLGAIMGGGGPGKSLAAMMPCTIIRKNDLAHKFLDHSKHPDWQGRTRSMVTAWPAAQETLWAEYRRLRREVSHEAANALYIENQAAMNEGASVDWPERFEDGKEISAIQHAENLLCDLGEEVFFAEYQNDPKDAMDNAPYILTPDTIMARTTKRAAWERPEWATQVIASTDVNQSYALSTVVLGFGPDQTAAVLWYGLHRMSIPGETPAPEAARLLYAALVAHGKELAGAAVRPDFWAIDGGGANFDTVARFAGESIRAVGIAAHCFTGRGARNYRPYGKSVAGPLREGCHPCLDRKDGRIIRWVAWHADHWREVWQRAWLGDVGAPGAVSLPAGHHGEFAQQVAAERLMGKGEVAGQPVWIWTAQPGRHDYGDAGAQGYAAAAYVGIGSGWAGAARKPSGKMRVAIYRPSAGRRG